MRKARSLVPSRPGSNVLKGLFLSILLLYITTGSLNRLQRQEVAAISLLRSHWNKSKSEFEHTHQ